MNYQDKTKEELITALLELQQENRDLKLSLHSNNDGNASTAEFDKKEQTGLSQKNDYFEFMFNTSPDAALITRLNDGMAIEANDGFTKLTGFTREETVGTSDVVINLWKNPEDRQLIVNDLLNNGFCENLEGVFVRKDGSSITGLISAKTFLLNDVPYIFSIVRDISERKKSEQALRESEARFRSYFELPFIGIAITSPEKGWIEANEGIREMLGYSMEELSGLTWAELTHPDDLAADVEQFNKVISDQKDTYFLKKRFFKKDGEIIWTNLSVGCVRKPDRSVDYMVALLQDITQRNLAENELQIQEERYRLLAENTRDVIWTMNLDGTITYISPSVEQMRGLTVEEAINQPLNEINTPESQVISMDYMRKLYAAIESGLPLPTFRGELEYYRKDGSTLWTEALVYPVTNRDGSSLSLLGVTRDISERKQSDEALRQSEEKFRSLYANMIDGSALHTLIYNDQGVPEDYRIIEVNPEFETMLGISRETVINKNSREAYGVDVPPYFEIYSRVALTGKPEVFETYFAPLDKYFSISVYCPYKGSFATIFENITERKKAEQELRIVLTKYQVLFNIFPVGITITNSAGSIIESNPIAETLLGISIEEQEKRKIDGQEWRIIRPDGTTMPASEFASVRALDEERQVTNVEMGILKGNNQITWLNVSASPMPIDGYGVAIVYGDITERKLAENDKERTQKLLEDSQRIGKIGGWEVNMDTMELKWTKEMYHIHEVDLTFKPSVDLRTNFFTPESLPVIDKAFQDALEQGGSYEVDSEIITAKGNRRSVKSIAKVDLENRRVFGLFQDITDQKQVEAELKIKNEQLKELNATKDKFFSIIAHDLKTPFSGILGFSEILKDEARNLDIASIEDYADILNSTAKQAFKLLENLLDWARMQQGSFYFEPIPIPFNYLLKTEIEGLKHSAGRKNITLVNETNEEINITADEKMLSSVLRNLISNAIKFTPKEGKINIEARRGIDHVEVSISDNGVGMEKEILEKLFKIETSFTSRGTENEKGTGLGLLLCKEFIEKHGGTIWVDSEKGKGSTFTFSIPLTTKIH